MHTNNFKAAFSRFLFNELKNIINKNLCNLVLRMPLATLESIYLARKIKTRIRGSKVVPVVSHEFNLLLISLFFKIWILILKTRISSNQIKSLLKLIRNIRKTIFPTQIAVALSLDVCVPKIYFLHVVLTCQTPLLLPPPLIQIPAPAVSHEHSRH